MTLDDLFEATKIVTIKSATKADGNIDRAKADRILDPHGYFKPKRPDKKR